MVVIPGEVFLADAPRGAQPARLRAVSPVVRPDQESLAAAAQVLNTAGRVTILAGAGCAGAHDQLIALAAAATGEYALHFETQLRRSAVRRILFQVYLHFARSGAALLGLDPRGIV